MLEFMHQQPTNVRDANYCGRGTAEYVATDGRAEMQLEIGQDENGNFACDEIEVFAMKPLQEQQPQV